MCVCVCVCAVQIGLQPTGGGGKTGLEKSKRGKHGGKGFSSRHDRQNAHVLSHN